MIPGGKGLQQKARTKAEECCKMHAVMLGIFQKNNIRNKKKCEEVKFLVAKFLNQNSNCGANPGHPRLQKWGVSDQFS